MRFRLAELPEPIDFSPDNSQHPHQDKGSSIWAWQLKALPVAILNMGIILLGWSFRIDLGTLFSNISFPLPIKFFILCLVGVLIIHELIHAAAHPKAGLSKRTIIGFQPSRMLLYTYYDGELTRNHYLVILAMPFITLSVLPILMASILDFDKFWLVYITVLNAFLSSGDILAISEIMKIPAGAIIRNKKSDTYWKRKE